MYINSGYLPYLCLSPVHSSSLKKSGMYEVHLGLYGFLKRVFNYALIFLCLSSLNARQKWLLPDAAVTDRGYY